MDDGISSWQEDLRAELVHQFVTRVVSAAEVEELELPHIVVCRDEESGTMSFSGPFPDAVEALVFAERESRLDQELSDDDPLEFSVAALHPVRRPEL